MPAEAIVEGVVRILMRFLIDIVLDVLIKGPGHLLMHLFRPGKPRSEGVCAMLGMALWALVAALAYLMLR